MADTTPIPAGDLPKVTPGTLDSVVGVDEATGAARRFGLSELPASASTTAAIAALGDRVDVIEAGQSAGILGYATKALMTDDLAHAEGTLALVTNDDVDPVANNGTYRKSGASGSGSWVLSADRVTGLENSVDAADLDASYSNIFNKDDPANASGYSIDASGNLTTSAGFFTTHYMPVQPSTTYARKPTAVQKYVAYYDASKAFISRPLVAAAATNFTTPANAYYIRWALNEAESPASSLMFTEGTSLPATYSPWTGRVVVREGSRNVADGFAGLGSTGYLDPALIDPTAPVNLLDASAVSASTTLSLSGVTSADANFFTTDYIRVDPGEAYAFTTAALNKYVCQYDGNLAFIATIQTTSVFTPVVGTQFVRISMRYTDTTPGSAMVVKGALPGSYAAYGGKAVMRAEQRDAVGGFAGIGSDGRVRPFVLPTVANPLAGKVIAGLGDSITYGFIPRNAPGYPGQLQSWLPLVAAKFGAQALNYGISGSTLGWNNVGTTDAERNYPFTQRYSSMSDTADLIIVMGGTNDVRKGVPLGAMGDTTDLTYYGALDVLCQGLLNKYRYTPGTTVGATKKIMFMTPIKLFDNSTTDKLNANLPAYCAAMKAVCAKYGIPVFDAYNESGLTPHLFRTVVGTEPGYTDNYNPYMTDGTHPTQEGQSILADAVAGFIRTLY